VGRRVGGFTVAELVIVLAIAGILVAIAFPAVQEYIEKSRRTQAILDIKEMSEAIRASDKTSGALPASLAAAGYANKTDPWGNAYQYFNLRDSVGNGVARKDKKLAPLNSDFDLYSIGPDGLTQASLGNASSRDDIVRARDGAFIGTAQEFDP
jgi:general secretion pathway protein G